jgi:predicted nuclease of predicted toxin-antitoxin system
MRFLANENFPADAVTQLKAAGHDIVWVRTAAPGMKDEDVLAWAAREARIVLTFDKDFDELAWRAGLRRLLALYCSVTNAARSGGRHHSCRPDC